MDIFKSFGLLLWGTIKRFWAMLPSLLLDPFDIAKLFNMNYEPPAYLFWILFSLGLTFAVVMTYHELRTKYLTTIRGKIISTSPNIVVMQEATDKKDPRYDKDGKRIWSEFDLSFVVNTGNQVLINHKHHHDIAGIIADFEDGKSYGELLTANCKECGEPRNKKLS